VALPDPRDGFDGEDIAGRCADLIHTFGVAYGWTREQTLFDTPWSELVLLRDKAKDYHASRNEFEASIHGYELVDGGAAGSGLPPQKPGSRPYVKPDQGTSAWQQSVKRNMELNAKQRRN
jgi:hypothetical protein